MASVIVPQHTAWKRDPGIRELIRYFNQPKFVESPDPKAVLSRNDRSLILDEIRKCQDNFRYAARNYFWIIDEHGQDILLKLLESQELILEKIEWLRNQGKAQKVMILKARRLGASTLVEAIIAWKTMFFYNSIALVLADKRDLATSLFGIMLNIYDKMPWWLKPDYTNKTYDGGLIFDNPDEKDRVRNLGLKSKIVVQVAGGQSSVAQGYRISVAHVSEYSSYEEWRAKEIIEGDLSYSLANNVGTIAALESTGKGSGTYAEKLWNANIKLAERAEWLPIFLPTFFEKSRVLSPPKGWRPQQPEDDIRKIAANEWVRCDNASCLQYRESLFGEQWMFDSACPTCRAGTLRAVQLTDAQLYYMEDQRINKEAKGDEAVRELHQELAVTAQDAFQLSGYPVFPRSAIEWVTSTVTERPIAHGYLDSKCRFHGVDMRRAKPDQGYYPCISRECDQNHHFDPDDQKTFTLWEEPEPDERYAIGADPADGLGGEADSSVGWVNRLGKMPQDGDVHVATFASNTIDPEDFAAILVRMGRYFNEAMLAIEYNKEACGNSVKNYYQYPNLFRWKHYDNLRMESHKVHWYTNQRTKPLLDGHAVRWLKARLWRVRDPEFLVQMKKYQKLEYEERGGKAEHGSHDDYVLAGEICLFCSHDQDWDPDTQTIPLPRGATKEAGEWIGACDACHRETECANPPALRFCPECGSLKLRFRRKLQAPPQVTLDLDDWPTDLSPVAADSVRATLIRYNQME